MMHADIMRKLTIRNVDMSQFSLPEMVKKVNKKNTNLLLFDYTSLLKTPTKAHREPRSLSREHFGWLSKMAHGGNPAFLFRYHLNEPTRLPGNMVIKSEGTGSQFFIYQRQPNLQTSVYSSSRPAN